MPLSRREGRGDHDRTVPKRGVARWVLALTLVPMLLIIGIGLFLINLLAHTERAVSKISQPSVADIVHGTATALPDLRPTNTPNPRGTTAPLATLTPAPTPLPAPRFDRKDPFTVMLLGVEDQRNGPDDLSRSDTIILAYVDPLAKHVNLLSIPRDLRVTQPGGMGPAKMADVFAHGDQIKYKGVGGVALVWDTIEQSFQIKIDYYVRANFDGFVKIVDAVGGVTVDNPYPIKDDEYPTPDFQYSRVFFPAGIVHLDGPEALEYVRTRHDDDDFARNARQQQVILAVREQAIKLDLLPKASDVIDALGDAFQTDFPKEQWLGFARFGTEVRADAIQQFSLTDLLASETIGGVYYAAINWPQALARAREFSPKENFQAMQTQAQQGLDTGVTVTVENGTRIAGLANGWSVALRGKGFGHVAFIDAPPAVKGNVAKSRVYYFGQNEATARALATLMGLDASSVEDGTGKRPAETPPGTDILVLLGDDARDPG